MPQHGLTLECRLNTHEPGREVTYFEAAAKKRRSCVRFCRNNVSKIRPAARSSPSNWILCPGTLFSPNISFRFLYCVCLEPLDPGELIRICSGTPSYKRSAGVRHLSKSGVFFAAPPGYLLISRDSFHRSCAFLTAGASADKSVESERV